MATNKKKVLFTDSMGKAGVALLTTRGDIEGIPFPNMSQDDEYHAILKKHGPVHATILGGTRFRKAELDAAGAMEVVARVGVGYDAIDIPAMTAAKVPVMIAGTANSPSVAEHAMSFMLTLARKGPQLTALVKEGRWGERLRPEYVTTDLFEKTVLIVGFGRIGTRTAKRCQAMEMNVLIYDPYVRPRRSRRQAASRSPTSTRHSRELISSPSTAQRRPRRSACSAPSSSRR